MKTTPVIAILSLLLTGCASTWTRFEPFSAQHLEPKPRDYNIPVSPGVPTNRSYEKLGVVWSSWYTYPSAEAHVRQKAKSIGADAVINVRYTTYDVNINYALGSFTTTGVAGTAVSSGAITSMGYVDGYPKVVGVAIRFTDNSQEQPKFTNPNVVDPRQPSGPAS